MRDQIASQSPGRRAAAYWFADGLPELGFGVLYLIWSAVGIAWGFDPKAPWRRGSVIAAAVAFLLFFIWDRRVLEFFKARMTYPRTGYARPPADAGAAIADPCAFPPRPVPVDENVTHFRTRTAFLFFVAMQMVEMTAMMGNGEPKWWAVPVFTCIAAALEYWWNRDEPRRYAGWTIVPIAVAGVLSIAWNLPGRSRQFVPLLIGGAWLAAHGAWTLAGYLRSNPRQPAIHDARS